MGFFNNFPYTNFHEINLDWILKTVKETVAKTSTFEQALNEVKKTLASLNISAEVAAKLEEMENSGELAEIISNVFAEIRAGSFEMVFLSDKPDIGTCCVMHCDGVTAIYDIGESDGSTLIEYLRTKNYKKIDYIFISHPHSDHIGTSNASGLSNLLAAADLDFSSCKAVLCCQNVDWTRWIGNNYSATMATLGNIFTAKNIEILNPRSGDIVNIGSARAEILNVDGGDFERYYNYTLDSNLADVGVTNLNNFSMCIKITHNDYSYFLSGDIEAPAEENMAVKCANVDVLLIEHHGYNYESADNYLNTLNPRIGIIAAYPGEYPSYQSIHPTEYKVLSNGVVLNTYNGGNVRVWDNVYGLGFETSTGFVSNAGYNSFYAGRDIRNSSKNWNEFKPGLTCVQNQGLLLNSENFPASFNSASFAATLIATQYGTPWQFGATVGTRHARMAVRTGDNLGDHPWKYIQPGAYFYKAFTGDDFRKNVTLSTSGDILNRIHLQNNLCTVVFDFTTNEEIPAGYSNGIFLIVETGGANNSRGAYVALMNKTSGEVYPVRISTTGKNIEFYCDKTIPSGVNLCGCATFDCNASSSAET